MSASTSTSTRSLKNKKPYKPWSKDGINGGPSSLDIIVDWLTTGSNYARWRGDGEGITKKTLAGEIIAKMRANGIDHRVAKDVINKIASLQIAYNGARDWKENTGEGLRLDGTTEATIHGNVKDILVLFTIM